MSRVLHLYRLTNFKFVETESYSAVDCNMRHVKNHLLKSNIEIAIIFLQIARFDKIWHTAELSIIKPILPSLCYAVTLTIDLERVW